MDITQKTDEEIVEIVRDSNQELYVEIVNRYESKLYGYIMRIVNDESNAADITQDTFIKAYENLQGFDIKRKFSSWIYRIAHNTALNSIKKGRRLVFDWDFSLMEGKSQNNPESQFEKNQIIEELHKNLNKISIKYREILTLYYLEDKSYEEISDILRIPVGTVGTRMNRGRKLLKNIYKE